MQANTGEGDVDLRVRRRLRELRTQQGLTLEGVATRAGIDVSTLSRLDSGKRRLALDHLPRLAEAGKKAVLVSAIGFVCDHVEILFDLNIEARGIAEGLGMHFERAGALNDHPALLEGLAGIVTAEARSAGWLA